MTLKIMWIKQYHLALVNIFSVVWGLLNYTGQEIFHWWILERICAQSKILIAALGISDSG
jgi:hypothetical protein